MNWARQSLAFVVSGSLALATAQVARADDVEKSVAQPNTPVLQQMPDGLKQIVAPIALYPDTMVAQILAASVYPNEVLAANQWMQEHSSLTGEALAQAVNQQSWDPSVKSLTQFPLVLANMAKNLSWTWALGDSYETDPQNVLDAIQVMRQRAEQAGNLRGSPQEVITVEGQTTIIQPAEADTVYLPEYDPWLVYGAPIDVYPGWNPVPGLFVDQPGELFGPGIGIGAFAGFGWGWNHWGADWYGRHLVYDQDAYIPHRQAFVNLPNVYGPRSATHAGGFHGDARHSPVGMRYATNGGFSHVGTVRNFAFRGRTGVGGSFHSVTGGFHAGGFHGGGFHGGGRR